MTTPAYTTTLDLTDSTWGKNLDESYQYWELEFSDVSMIYVWIGYLYMGDYLQLPGINPNYVLNYNTTSSTTLSVSMQPYGDKGIQHFSSSFTFPIITDYVTYNPAGEEIAQRVDILEMWYELEGYTPFYIEIAEDATDKIPPIFGIFNTGSFQFKLDSSQNFYSLEFGAQETK